MTYILQTIYYSYNILISPNSPYISKGVWQKMPGYIEYRMERERTLLARKQIQLAMISVLMTAAMVLVLLFNSLFA